MAPPSDQPVEAAALRQTSRRAALLTSGAGYGFGMVLILSPFVDPAMSVTFPIWVIALSVLLLFHIATLPDDELPGSAERMAEPDPAAGA